MKRQPIASISEKLMGKPILFIYNLQNQCWREHLHCMLHGLQKNLNEKKVYSNKMNN